MSRLRGTLELDLEPDRVAVVCRQVFGELAWELRADDGSVIVAEEDAVRLSCRRWPAKSRLQISRGDEGGSSVAIETEVPGIGPISSTQARDRQLAVVRRIYAGAASETPSSSSSRATVSGVSR
jgi:hypothetical protein